jgi:methionyl aminopeptidase
MPETMVEDVELWRRAGKIGASALALGQTLVRPGALLFDIAEDIEAEIRKQGALPAFPANISTNDEAAHYTPFPGDTRRVKAGDVIKLDIGAHLDGCVSDTAATVEAGSSHHATLILAAREALEAAEAALHGGVDSNDVSDAIENAIHKRGLKPVSNLTGHNIERYNLHAGKSVPNVVSRPSVTLDEGEIIAIEPFATHGDGMIRDGSFGNIMRFRVEPKKEKEPELAKLFTEFRTLPFCLRWVKDEDVRRLVMKRRGYLQTYPVFVETGKGLVAQAEKTFLLTADGAEMLT